jgi:hypothetical protein
VHRGIFTGDVYAIGAVTSGKPKIIGNIMASYGFAAKGAGSILTGNVTFRVKFRYLVI